MLEMWFRHIWKETDESQHPVPKARNEYDPLRHGRDSLGLWLKLTIKVENKKDQNPNVPSQKSNKSNPAFFVDVWENWTGKHFQE